MKRFLKSAFLISVGGALPLLSGLILLLPYTQYLEISDYGALAIYISFSLLVQYLMNFGIDTYLSVHYYDHNHDPAKLKKFIASVFGLLFILGGIFISIFSLVGALLFNAIFSGDVINFFPYGIMSVFTAFCNAFFRTYVNLQVFAGKPVKYFLFGLFNFVVTVVISIVLIIEFPFTLIGPMWGRMISGILIFILTCGYLIKEYGIRFDRKIFPDIRTYCFPLIIFNILTWVLAYINNYILEGMETVTEVGIYDFALKCTLLIEYAGLGIMGTMNPQIFQLWKSNAIAAGTKEENRYHHVFSGFNILFIALNILILPVVIRLIVQNESWHASIPLIPILCLSFVFKGLNNAFTNPLYFYKKTRVLPKILLITAIIQIILGIVLIQYFGIWGAVLSFFFVKPIQIFFLWLESRKVFSYDFNLVKMVIIPILYLSLVLIIYELTDIPEIYKGLIQLMIAILLVGGVYLKEIKEVAKKLKLMALNR